MKICDDCKKVTYQPALYVGGAVRCGGCANVFSAANAEKIRVAESKRRANHVCNVTDDVCEKCCEHQEHDHFICLDCGAEREPSDYYDEDYGQER